jgi:hypothetical protein
LNPGPGDNFSLKINNIMNTSYKKMERSRDERHKKGSTRKLN